MKIIDLVRKLQLFDPDTEINLLCSQDKSNLIFLKFENDSLLLPEEKLLLSIFERAKKAEKKAKERKL